MLRAQKITPCLWFNDQAEEAVHLYTSIFDRSKIVSVSRRGDGAWLTAIFELEGQRFMALNGGPQFPFTEAVSFSVSCETQDEIDTYWGKLTADGGQESRCGWLKDRFGVSWQIVPTVLGELLNGQDPAKSQRAMQAMLAMNKLDIARLQEAYNG